MGAARCRSLALDAGLRAHGSRHGTANRCSQGTDGRGSHLLAGARRCLWGARLTARHRSPLLSGHEWARLALARWS
eukprot:2203153-Prymnesium_polylepis.1